MLIPPYFGINAPRCTRIRVFMGSIFSHIPLNGHFSPFLKYSAVFSVVVLTGYSIIFLAVLPDLFLVQWFCQYCRFRLLLNLLHKDLN